jgi:hypothetical protein
VTGGADQGNIAARDAIQIKPELFFVGYLKMAKTALRCFYGFDAGDFSSLAPSLLPKQGCDLKLSAAVNRQSSRVCSSNQCSRLGS